MERLIFVPIERLEERYSDQWWAWFEESFKRAGIEACFVGGNEKHSIKTGQFLDVINTCLYKSKQMVQVVEMIESGFEGTIFFMDLWFPGIEHLAYIRDNAKRKIKIGGILHAGTWDYSDFLFQNGCRNWAKFTESGWFEIVDKIVVATEFHKKMIVDRSLSDSVASKIEVVEFPCYRNDHALKSCQKENIVVFPHRIAKEKNPVHFDAVEAIFRNKHPQINVEFIKTKDVCQTKDDYYDLLSRSKVSFSAADQETFGIAMLESVALGCVPVAPDRLSYQETLKEFPRYKTLTEAVELIYNGILDFKKTSPRYRDNADALVYAIERML